MAQQPYIKFFGTDWRSDPALRLCSAAARGVWADCLTLMMEAEPFGYLLVNGRPATVEQIAALTVTPVAVVRKALEELAVNGVSHRIGDSDHPEDIAAILRADLPPETIFCRRMLRDKARSDKGKSDGKKGGNPKLGGKRPQVAPEEIPDEVAGGYGEGLTPALTGADNTHSHSQYHSQKEEKNNGSSGGDEGRYAFAGDVIRLTRKDFETWKRNFHGIPDICAELSNLDVYYSSLPAGERKNWFVRCSTALNNKHQENLARRPPKTGGAGVQATPENWGDY